MKDWREEYVVCEHVAADADLDKRHAGFRVCCVPCADAGFLRVENIKHERRGALCVGTI